MLVIIIKHHEIVTAGIESRLQDFEVDGRHLGTDDGIILSHLFGKGHLFDSGGVNGAFFPKLFPDCDGGQKRADTDPGCTQIVDLVDL